MIYEWADCKVGPYFINVQIVPDLYHINNRIMIVIYALIKAEYGMPHK